MSRSTVKERLAARINLILTAVDYAHVTVKPGDLRSTHAGRNQRSEGAWSWAVMLPMQIGGYAPMSECVSRPVTAAWDCHDSLVIAPAEPLDGAPEGADFGINVAPVGLKRRWVWYDGNGKPL